CGSPRRRPSPGRARSPRAGSEGDLGAETLLARLAHDELGRSEILDPEAERLEHRQLVLARSAGMLAHEHLAELRRDPLRAEAREEEVARLVQRRLATVDDEGRCGDRLRVQLTRARHARAD